ncbi:MAG: hypothetical protein AAF616_13320 [Bacteroidota bacterium]
MPPKDLKVFAIAGLLFAASAFLLGNFIGRNESSFLLSVYCLFFFSYLLLLFQNVPKSYFFWLGVSSRILLFFSMPALSDDIYRFLWDGYLLKNGLHPFAELPGFYLDHLPTGLTEALYERLNSPNYFTIYPPLNQGLFWLCVQIGDSWLASTNVLRTVILIADLGSLWLLKKILPYYSKDPKWSYAYFLNPLVILELTGNLHFEGLVVFFLLLGMYAYKTRNVWFSAAGFGLAIGTKLLPLIYLPYLLFSNLRSRLAWISVFSGVVGLLTLLPLASASFINGMGASLDLYFRKFEFNASIYYCAREVGIWILGYNPIAKLGPALSVTSVVYILAISVIGTRKGWRQPFIFLLILLGYLALSTTVHPWYIIPLIAFGILSGFWFPLVWSLTVFLTYLGYSELGFQLPIWVVAVEYSLVAAFALFEFLILNKRDLDL